MKIRTALFLASIVVLLPRVYAQNIELKPYGFVKGDASFTSAGVLSFTSPGILAPQFATGVDTAMLGFTGQHTRLGFKGSTGDDIKVGGVIELDFFTNVMEANLRPRLRLGYVWMTTGNFELRIGQQWDLFSPNNPMTNNTNGNMWYGGNMGARRGQVQLSYKMPMEDVTPALQIALCEGAQDPMLFDNMSLLPMLQGRVSATFMKKYSIGAYFVNTTFAPKPDSSDFNYSSSGFGLDFSLPLHDLFNLHGEFNTGTNLFNSNMFTIAGAGMKDLDKKNPALWLNVHSKVTDMVNVVVGFGMDKNNTDEMYIKAGDVLNNTVIYGDVIFPFKGGFSLTLEALSITTEYKDGVVNIGGVPNRGDAKRSSLVLSLGGKLVF